jgi:hypothetical protein
MKPETVRKQKANGNVIPIKDLDAHWPASHWPPDFYETLSTSFDFFMAAAYTGAECGLSSGCLRFPSTESWSDG